MRRRDADPAPDDHNGAEVLDMGGLPERSREVADLLAGLECGELLRGLADDLHDELDPALVGAAVGDRERYALSRVARAKDDELPRLPLLRDLGGLDLHPEYQRRNEFFLENLVHVTPRLSFVISFMATGYKLGAARLRAFRAARLTPVTCLRYSKKS